VRTTLTLDEDVANKLRRLTRQSGRPFRDVVNETLRRGLVHPPADSPRVPLKWNTRDLRLRPGLSLDNIGALLEQVEGPLHR